MEGDPRQIVRIENIVKDFRPGFGLRKKRVLHGISFSVREGEIFGFVGPNGAGKTTTLKVLLGLIRATSGETSILGHAVHETAFRRQIGFLPENPYFYTFLTGRETLHFYAKLSGVAGPLPSRGLALADLLEGHAATPRHRAGAGARSEHRLPRRADERPRPHRAGGDPGSHLAPAG
jgi:ABC-2 type transport system ATP-binding protein